MSWPKTPEQYGHAKRLAADIYNAKHKERLRNERTPATQSQRLAN